MSAPKEQSRAQQLMGDFAPKLAELTDDVLFGDVWARAELSQRDRSLITVAALIANGNTEQLQGERHHGDRACRGHDPSGLLYRVAAGNIRHPGREGYLQEVARNHIVKINVMCGRRNQSSVHQTCPGIGPHWACCDEREA
jgi:hypothetical protein